VLDATVHQRNMRVHVVAALLVGLAGGGLRVGVAEELALLVCVFLVLSAETLNTGLEALVDLYTVEIDSRARVAKDATAGAVLLLACGAALVFSAVLARAWPQLGQEPDRILAHAARAVPLAVLGALLVAPWRRSAAVDVALVVAGAGLLAALAPLFTSVALGALSAAAFALCAAAAFARGRGARPGVSPSDAPSSRDGPAAGGGHGQ
jgi:diacylglycerol kinase (ATP)